MPNVVIDFIEGRTVEQKRKLVESVTDAIVNSIGCKPEAVQIILHEISTDQISNGGVLRCDKK